MNSLFFSYDLGVESAYIIRVKDNERSEAMAKRCADSCTEVGMPFKFWDAYNGYSRVIKEPEHSKNNPLMKMLKITDHYLTRGEVACALSHISLWSHCAEQDKPIVILEHDAIMLQPYLHHNIYNSICYLGGNEQVNLGWRVLPTPPHASEGPNYHFICRAHAYAIDPAVAKNLLSHVLKFGIVAPLDIIVRADIFNIHQMGVYAYDMKETEEDNKTLKTTILGRPLEGRSTKRNDDLSV
jgi:GR25 family glycosyltransferase involved in LPS biosynthesis